MEKSYVFKIKFGGTASKFSVIVNIVSILNILQSEYRVICSNVALLYGN